VKGGEIAGGTERKIRRIYITFVTPKKEVCAV